MEQDTKMKVFTDQSKGWSTSRNYPKVNIHNYKLNRHWHQNQETGKLKSQETGSTGCQESEKQIYIKLAFAKAHEKHEGINGQAI